MVHIDEQDKKIIARLQGDLPLVSRPFAVLARELGMDEDDVVARVRRLADSGAMRRFGATLRHQKSGFSSNVMVAWQVDPDQASTLGPKLSSFRRVSHCYHRAPCQGFRFNLFTMVHGRSEAECRRIVEEMAASVGNPDHELLFSVEELKKTSMKYFDSEGDVHGG